MIPMSATGLRIDRGFTLLELLVVLCVAGLLLAAGAAVSVGKDRQVRRQTLAATEYLKAVRLKAWTSGKRQQVTVGRDALSSEGNGNMPGRQTGASFRMLEGGRDGKRAETIVFYPDRTSNGGVLEISFKGEARRVSVDWRGQIHAIR